MKKPIYSLWLTLFLLLPLTTFSQNQSVVWPWPVNEDTLYIQNLQNTGMYLNQIIAADTNGTGWQGADGRTKFLNNTRVYVLAKNGYFPMNGNLIFSRAGVKIMVRGERGNYVIPAHYTSHPANDWYPQIYFVPLGTGLPQADFVRVNGLLDTIMIKNVAICGRDENTSGTLDKIQGNMLEIGATGTGSIYVDSCLLKTVNGQIMQLGASGSTHAYTVRMTNTLIADMGFIGNGNLGAGRGIDCRNSKVDSLIVENNTWVNFQDRIIRHYISALPILSFKFIHNTVMNGMSYCGTISLGLIDSLGNGPFEIKDNLFLDNFAMGPDTDALRAAEFTDSPDMDPRSGTYKISWIVTRPNTTGHITPWVISNNYYGISDSGLAMRNLTSPYLYVPNPNHDEPILTSDLKRQLQANGGDTLTAFRKISFSPSYVPPLMTRLIRWYFTVVGDGVGGNDKSNVGAGAGRAKTGSGSGTGTPASHFIHDVTNNVWVYDFNRQKTEWYLDSVDCSISSAVNLALAASDGRIVGDTRWSFTLIPVITGTFTPATIDFGTVAKNASKTDTVVVSSTGNSPLMVDSVKSTAAEFTISPSTATIANGQSKQFVITYHPTTPGAKSGKVVFYHKGVSAQDTVSVTGDVVVAAAFEASVTTINFGTVNTNVTKKDSVDVTNHGTIDLTITAVTSSNPVFTVTPTTATVGVEASKWFYITFAPTANGAQTGKIAFTHNALTHDTITVTGNGNLVSVNGLNAMIPEVYALHNNYPNPFNPSTTIQYDLPKQSMVTLKVYSLLGQEVATLVDGVMEAGYQHVVWNGQTGKVSSGVYFYRIFAKPTDKGEAFTQVKKMLMLK